MAHQSELIATDIGAYLHAQEHKSLLRFITCGSVDDGKSTLIGRLLYEAKMLFEDQLAAVEADVSWSIIRPCRSDVRVSSISWISAVRLPASDSIAPVSG